MTKFFASDKPSIAQNSNNPKRHTSKTRSPSVTIQSKNQHNLFKFVQYLYEYKYHSVYRLTSSCRRHWENRTKLKVLGLLVISLLLCETVAFSRPGNLIQHHSRHGVGHGHLSPLPSQPFTKSKQYHIHQRNSVNNLYRNTISLNALPIAAAAVSTTAKATMGTAASKLSFSSILASLHGDPFYVLSSVLLLSSFGMILEKRTTIGKALSVSEII